MNGTKNCETSCFVANLDESMKFFSAAGSKMGGNANAGASGTRQRVFFDITIDGQPAGRIVMEVNFAFSSFSSSAHKFTKKLFRF